MSRIFAGDQLRSISQASGLDPAKLRSAPFYNLVKRPDKASAVPGLAELSKLGQRRIGQGAYRSFEVPATSALPVNPPIDLAAFKIKMISVSGTPGFSMGSDSPEHSPIRSIALRRYSLAENEVTNAQFRTYLRATRQEPRNFSEAEENYPVVFVTWFDAISFCNWLSRASGRGAVYIIDDNGLIWNREANGFRLPTEAEWEYAARGRRGYKFPWGKKFPDYHKVCCRDNARDHQGRMPVGSYPKGKGPFGHLDLAGNVWEWCFDWFGTYSVDHVNNPAGPPSGSSRVVRGGSWLESPGWVFSGSWRAGLAPNLSNNETGFRIAAWD